MRKKNKLFYLLKDNLSFTDGLEEVTLSLLSRPENVTETGITLDLVTFSTLLPSPPKDLTIFALLASPTRLFVLAGPSLDARDASLFFILSKTDTFSSARLE